MMVFLLIKQFLQFNLLIFVKILCLAFLFLFALPILSLFLAPLHLSTQQHRATPFPIPESTDLVTQKSFHFRQMMNSNQAHFSMPFFSLKLLLLFLLVPI
jgi:hypothetical protein